MPAQIEEGAEAAAEAGTGTASGHVAAATTTKVPHRGGRTGPASGSGRWNNAWQGNYKRSVSGKAGTGRCNSSKHGCRLLLKAGKIPLPNLIHSQKPFPQCIQDPPLVSHLPFPPECLQDPPPWPASCLH